VVRPSPASTKIAAEASYLPGVVNVTGRVLWTGVLGAVALALLTGCSHPSAGHAAAIHRGGGVRQACGRLAQQEPLAHVDVTVCAKCEQMGGNYMYFTSTPLLGIEGWSCDGIGMRGWDLERQQYRAVAAQAQAQTSAQAATAKSVLQAKRSTCLAVGAQWDAYGNCTATYLGAMGKMQLQLTLSDSGAVEPAPRSITETVTKAQCRSPGRWSGVTGLCMLSP